MSIISGFKDRHPRATVLTVLFPEKKEPSGEPGTKDYEPGQEPQIQLTVNKLNSRQLRAAKFAGEKLAADRGYSRENPNWDEGAWQGYLYALVDQMKPAVTEWKSLTDEPLPKFNQRELERFLEEQLGMFEILMLLGLAYFNAHAAEEKNATAPASSETAS